MKECDPIGNDEPRLIYVVENDYMKLVDDVSKLQESLKAIRRWSEAFDPDICEPLSPDDMTAYADALAARGLSIAKLNGELVRRIMADVVPIINEALEEESGEWSETGC